MKIKRSTDVAEARVELVPLIDCVFLLLIFFMCAATMTKVDAPTDVRLPIASNGAEQKDPSRRGTVNVMPVGARAPGGEIATAERPFLVFGQLMGDEALQAAMTEHLKSEPNMRLYLRADRNAFKFAAEFDTMLYLLDQRIDRRGKALTIKLSGPVEPYLRDAD